LMVGLGELSRQGLWVVRLENRNAVAVIRAVGLMVTAHGEKANTGVDQRLGSSGAGNFGNVLTIVGQIAYLDDEFHPRY
jgi:hypothetical protein